MNERNRHQRALSNPLKKLIVTDKQAVSKVDFFLGIVFGITVGFTALFIWTAIEPLLYPYPQDIVCQNGRAFVATDYGSEVYLKTTDECIDTRITEGGK
jgi:hypothetical protein